MAKAYSDVINPLKDYLEKCVKSVEHSDPEKSFGVLVVKKTSSMLKSSMDQLLEIVFKSVASTNACFLKQGKMFISVTETQNVHFKFRQKCLRCNHIKYPNCCLHLACLHLKQATNNLDILANNQSLPQEKSPSSILDDSLNHTDLKKKKRQSSSKNKHESTSSQTRTNPSKGDVSLVIFVQLFNTMSLILHS